ncbi:MAG: biotin/lipoyl-containing protein [Vicinamibacterales bacterium]
MAEKLQVRFGDDTTSLVVGDDGIVTVADRTYTVTPVSAGIYRVDNGTRHWTVAVAGSGESRWVFVDGVVAELEVTPEGGSRRRGRRGASDQMAAPMPATVVKLLVGPGDAVAEGDTLIVLEAMKMELAVRAPRDGVVKDVRCAEGDLVQPGVNLLELES